MPEHEYRRNVALAVATTFDGRPHYQIAAVAKINSSAFSGIVSGRVTPTSEQRKAIAVALDRLESELFEAVVADA